MGHEIRVAIVSMVEIVFFWGEVLEGAVCQQPAPCGGCAADVAEEWKLWPSLYVIVVLLSSVGGKCVEREGGVARI